MGKFTKAEIKTLTEELLDMSVDKRGDKFIELLQDEDCSKIDLIKIIDELSARLVWMRESV